MKLEELKQLQLGLDSLLESPDLPEGDCITIQQAKQVVDDMIYVRLTA